jgi:predicted nucleotidyltransferase component of viral defense system
MMNRAYIDAVRLLLEVAPEIFREPVFALKGGTAINLFLHDMPRLSVDLDLVFIDHRPGRDEALERIGAALDAASAELESRGMRCDRGSGTEETKLFVERDRVRVKIEVNHVFRGTVLPVSSRPLSENTQNTFFTDIELPVLHPDELYGSKLVAAMDRQHPRDLFDVLGLYARDGLTQEIVECFVCYLAGHNRPVHEVLFANQIDIVRSYANEFVGMTRNPLALDELLQVRNSLFAELPSALTTNHREFLMGLVQCEPDWLLMSCPHIKDLPAIRWKLANLERLRGSNPAKFSEQQSELRRRLDT